VSNVASCGRENVACTTSGNIYAWGNDLGGGPNQTANARLILAARDAGAAARGTESMGASRSVCDGVGLQVGVQSGDVFRRSGEGGGEGDGEGGEWDWGFGDSWDHWGRGRESKAAGGAGGGTGAGGEEKGAQGGEKEEEEKEEKEGKTERGQFHGFHPLDPPVVRAGGVVLRTPASPQAAQDVQALPGPTASPLLRESIEQIACGRRFVVALSTVSGVHACVCGVVVVRRVGVYEQQVLCVLCALFVLVCSNARSLSLFHPGRPFMDMGV
jgi:hypothetical protein